MEQLIAQFLLPARYADEPAMALRSRIFHLIVLILLIGLPIMTLNLFLGGDRAAGSAVLVGLGLIVGALVLVRRGHLEIGTAVLPPFMLLLVATVMLFGNGLRDVTLSALSGVILIGGLLLNRGAYIALTIATLAVCAGIGFAEINGLLVKPYSSLTGYNNVFHLCVILLVISVPVRILVELLEQYLREVTQKNEKLVQSYDELARQSNALNKLEDRFAKMFAASPDPIVISRQSDGRYLEVNQAWIEAFGYSREESVGRTSLEMNLWVQPDDRARLLQMLHEGQTVRRFEHQVRKKSGEIADALMSVEVFDLDGIPHLVAQMIDITDRKLAEQRIQQLATRDALTGLPNRLLLTDRLTLAIGNARRENGKVAVLLIDLDRFKNINDSLGHLFGDNFLQAVSERLSAMMRAGDTLSRLGADEFIVLLEDLESAEEAAQVSRKILAALSEPFTIDGRELTCTCTIGISLYPSDSADPQTLIRDADTAMSHAKDISRGTYHFFSSEMNERVKERLWLENGLREAIANNEFEMVYQPKVGVSSGNITGLEALLRWRHPQMGLIAPGRFIDVAEETGLIVPIGRWAFQNVCEQIAHWNDVGAAYPVAVNLSVRQFNTELVSDISRTLRHTGIDPALVELEITESLFMRDPVEIGGILRALSGIGAHVTIDDFGTGFSSLSSIKRFFVNALKIDRSFISDIAVNPQDVAIVRAVIAMAHSLGIRVVAEGVEQEQQLNILRGLDCNEYQGYLFARPMPAAELEQRFVHH